MLMQQVPPVSYVGLIAFSFSDANKRVMHNGAALTRMHGHDDLATTDVLEPTQELKFDVTRSSSSRNTRRRPCTLLGSPPASGLHRECSKAERAHRKLIKLW
jgi:hypothetical protein